MKWKGPVAVVLIGLANLGGRNFLEGYLPPGDPLWLLLYPVSLVLILAIFSPEIFRLVQGRTAGRALIVARDWSIGIVAAAFLLVLGPDLIWRFMPPMIPAFTLLYRLVGFLCIASWLHQMIFSRRDNWRADFTGVFGILMFSTPEIMNSMFGT